MVARALGYANGWIDVENTCRTVCWNGENSNSSFNFQHTLAWVLEQWRAVLYEIPRQMMTSGGNMILISFHLIGIRYLRYW